MRVEVKWYSNVWTYKRKKESPRKISFTITVSLPSECSAFIVKLQEKWRNEIIWMVENLWKIRSYWQLFILKLYNMYTTPESILRWIYVSILCINVPHFAVSNVYYCYLESEINVRRHLRNLRNICLGPLSLCLWKRNWVDFLSHNYSRRLSVWIGQLTLS